MSNEQRTRLAAQRAQETDPVQREAYALAERAGFDWYDTESGARRMAEHAAAEIHDLRAALADTLDVFRESMGREAWGEWVGTSKHGVQALRVIDAAVALLNRVRP